MGLEQPGVHCAMGLSILALCGICAEQQAAKLLGPHFSFGKIPGF